MRWLSWVVVLWVVAGPTGLRAQPAPDGEAGMAAVGEEIEEEVDFAAEEGDTGMVAPPVFPTHAPSWWWLALPGIVWSLLFWQGRSSPARSRPRQKPKKWPSRAPRPERQSTGAKP